MQRPKEALPRAGGGRGMENPWVEWAETEKPRDQACWEPTGQSGERSWRAGGGGPAGLEAELFRAWLSARLLREAIQAFGAVTGSD